MAVRMAGTTPHLDGLRSIPDVADYIDSLVLSVDQMDGATQFPEVSVGVMNSCRSNQKPTVSVSACPEKS